jgi:hypothetical protein
MPQLTVVNILPGNVLVCTGILPIRTPPFHVRLLQQHLDRRVFEVLEVREGDPKFGLVLSSAVPAPVAGDILAITGPHRTCPRCGHDPTDTKGSMVVCREGHYFKRQTGLIKGTSEALTYLHQVRECRPDGTHVEIFIEEEP